MENIRVTEGGEGIIGKRDSKKKITAPATAENFFLTIVCWQRKIV